MKCSLALLGNFTDTSSDKYGDEKSRSVLRRGKNSYAKPNLTEESNTKANRNDTKGG